MKASSTFDDTPTYTILYAANVRIPPLSSAPVLSIFWYRLWYNTSALHYDFVGILCLLVDLGQDPVEAMSVLHIHEQDSLVMREMGILTRCPGTGGTPPRRP